MSRTCVLRLGNDVTAARQARAFVRRAVGADVGDDLLDDALVVASELVANAVMHAGTASEIEVRVGPDVVEVRVTDGSTRAPTTRRLVGGLAAQGRGLVMLTALTASWGVEQHDDGKTVWAVLRAS